MCTRCLTKTREKPEQASKCGVGNSLNSFRPQYELRSSLLQAPIADSTSSVVAQLAPCPFRARLSLCKELAGQHTRRDRKLYWYGVLRLPEDEVTDIYNKEYLHGWEEMLRSSHLRLYYRHIARK